MISESQQRLSSCDPLNIHINTLIKPLEEVTYNHLRYLINQMNRLDATDNQHSIM